MSVSKSMLSSSRSSMSRARLDGLGSEFDALSNMPTKAIIVREVLQVKGGNRLDGRTHVCALYSRSGDALFQSKLVMVQRKRLGALCEGRQHSIT